MPKLTMMQEPLSVKDSLKTIWEYECTVDGNYENDQKQYEFATDGNVIELPDHALFASMSSGLFSKVFIISRDKKILWSAIPEKWDVDEKKWKPIHQYRASIIKYA